MTPAEIITDPIEFNRWWQAREPNKLDRKIRAAALEAALIFNADGLIILTPKGRVHRRKAFIGKLSPRLRRALAELERSKAILAEDAMS